MDAISEGANPDGEVLIEGGRVDKDGGEWVSISVIDSGPGIDPEILATLFEPFVTMRLDAKGTGLGLAVAEGIVREHGGMLLARNHPERNGAIFEGLLPGAGAEKPG